MGDGRSDVNVNDDTALLYADWKDCLSSDRDDVRLAATRAVLELRHDRLAQCVPNGIIQLLAKNASYIPITTTTTTPNEVEDERIAVTALQALLHWSSSSSPSMPLPTSTDLVHTNTSALSPPGEDGSDETPIVADATTASSSLVDTLEPVDATALLDRMLEIALSPRSFSSANGSSSDNGCWCQRVNLALALVANLTRSERGAVELVGRQWPDTAIPSSSVAALTAEGGGGPTKPSLELLLARFLSHPTYYTSPNNIKIGEDTTAATANILEETLFYKELLLQKEEADDNDDDEDTTAVKITLDTHDRDPYQHFAAILLNATQTDAGRAFVLKIHSSPNDATTSSSSSNTVLQMLLPQMKLSPNPLRRRGLAGMIRNCCHDRDSIWWFLNVVQIHKHLLYPLAGPEELSMDEKQGLDPDLWLQGPDKEREPDAATRKWLVECFLLLLSTGGPVARNTLRVDKTYVILKFADMVEEQEDISELIYDCVNYLRRDEYGTAEGSSDQLVDTAYSKLQSTQTVICAGNETTKDFDNVD